MADWVVPTGEVRRLHGEAGGADAFASRTRRRRSRSMPFYRTHRRRYSVYFDVITSAALRRPKRGGWRLHGSGERNRAPPPSRWWIGDAAEETEANYASEPADRPAGAPAGGRTARDPAGSRTTSRSMANAEMALVVTTSSNPGLPRLGTFASWSTGRPLRPTSRTGPRWDSTTRLIPMSAALTRGKTKVTVRFQAARLPDGSHRCLGCERQALRARGA